jgi:hypothetical protein
VARLRRLTKVVTGRYLACFPNFLEEFWSFIKPVVLVSAIEQALRGPR